MGEKAMKGKAITKVLSCLVVFVILMGAMPVSAVAEEVQTHQLDETGFDKFKLKETNEIVARSSSEISISNDKVILILYENGQFTMKNSSDGKWLLYPSDTSYISINVDGTVYAHSARGHNADALLDNYITSSLTKVNPNLAYISYTLPENVKITQKFELSGKAVKFSTEALNLDGASHTVEVRYLFDTQLDQNDGSPLYAPGIGTKTYETDIPNPSFPMWKGYDIYPNPTFESKGSLLTHPDRMVFAWWPNAVRHAWDYTPDPNQKFYTPGYLTSPKSDSCVLLYWDIGRISSSDTRSAITYYGMGVPKVEKIQEFIEKMEELQEGAEDTVNSWADGAAEAMVTTREDINVQIDPVTKLILYSSEGYNLIDLAKNPTLVGFILYGVEKLTSAVIGDLGERWKSDTEEMFIDKVGIASAWCWMDYSISHSTKELSHSEKREIAKSYLLGASAPSEEITTYKLKDPDNPEKWKIIELTPFTQVVNDKLEMKNSYQELVDYLEEQDTLPSNFDPDPYIEIANDVIDKSLPTQTIDKNGDGYIDPATEEFISLIKETNNGISRKAIPLGHVGRKLKIIRWLREKPGEKVTTIYTQMGAGSIIVGAIGKGVAAYLSGGVTLLSEMIFASGGVVGAGFLIHGEAINDLSEGTATTVAIISTRSFAEDSHILCDGLNTYYSTILEDLKDNQPTSTYKGQGTVEVNVPSTVTVEEDKEGAVVSGDIKIKNTGSKAIPVTAYVVVYPENSEDIVGFTALPSDVFNDILGQGATQTFEFDIPLTKNSNLEGCHGYTVEAYANLGIAKIGPDAKKVSIGTTCEVNNLYRHEITKKIMKGCVEEGEAASATYTPSTEARKSIISLVYRGSDLDLHVYDKKGKHVGVDYQTGEIENEIIGALYSGPSVRNEWIKLKNISLQNYEVKVVGVEVSSSEGFIVFCTETPEVEPVMALMPSIISLAACSGEIVTESLTLKEITEVSSLINVNLITTDLVHKNGINRIDSSNIQFSYNNFEIGAGNAMQVLMTISIPDDVISGTYTGKITATDNSGATDESIINVIVTTTGKCKVQITSHSSLQDCPSIIYANGHYYVAYQSWETSYSGLEHGWDIFIEMFASDWTPIARTQVTNNRAYKDSPSLLFANNKLYVAYVSNEKGATANDYDVIVKEYDPNSLACLSGEKYLTTLQSRQDLPTLYYKDGYFYLAYRSWERGSSYNGDIYIKKFDSNWNQLKKVQVTSKGSLQARPSLAYANGYIYVAYYSMETGDRDIFVKRLDSNLNLDGFKKQITSEASEQSFPSISFVNNQFTIVYGSTETGTLGIFMKKYDSNWNFIEKTKVIDDSSAHERRPAMTYAQNDYWIAYVHNSVGSDDWNIFAIIPGCEDGPSPTPTPTPTLKLLWEITVDKAEYSPGDYVHLTQQFTNEGGETVLIINPITTTFIAEDGSVVLKEDISSSISVTLGAGGQWSFGTSYKLPDDAPEGYYDVRVSISGGNYVKTAENLFFVKAESQIPSGGGIGISIKPKDVETTPGSTITYDITVYNYYGNTESCYISVDPGSCDYDWFGWHTKSISIPGRGQGQVPLSVTPTEVGIFKFEVKANVESNPSIYASQEGNINVVAAGGMDTTPPDVTNVMVSPSIASPGSKINISADVFDSSGVRWVRAFISKGGEHVVTVFMSDPDEDGVYTGTWQTMNFTESGIYNIGISATDTVGNEVLVLKAADVEIT